MRGASTPNPPARYPVVSGATWYRESGPRDEVLVNGESVWSIFAACPELGWAVGLVLTEDGQYRLDSDGRHMLRRLHGVIRINPAK